jgi:hypothetical protein
MLCSKQQTITRHTAAGAWRRRACMSSACSPAPFLARLAHQNGKGGQGHDEEAPLPIHPALCAGGCLWWCRGAGTRGMVPSRLVCKREIMSAEASKREMGTWHGEQRCTPKTRRLHCAIKRWRSCAFIMCQCWAVGSCALSLAFPVLTES